MSGMGVPPDTFLSYQTGIGGRAREQARDPEK